MTDHQAGQGRWEEIAVLRESAGASQIVCRDAFSGRWRPVTDSYWDDCVITVQWRASRPAEANPDGTSQPGPTVSRKRGTDPRASLGPQRSA